MSARGGGTARGRIVSPAKEGMSRRSEEIVFLTAQPSFLIARLEGFS
jgi:hypothetical protein